MGFLAVRTKKNWPNLTDFFQISQICQNSQPSQLHQMSLKSGFELLGGWIFGKNAVSKIPTPQPHMQYDMSGSPHFQIQQIAKNDRFFPDFSNLEKNHSLQMAQMAQMDFKTAQMDFLGIFIKNDDFQA